MMLTSIRNSWFLVLVFQALKKVANSKLSIGAVGNLANVPHPNQIN
jgi:hypothetical protein